MNRTSLGPFAMAEISFLVEAGVPMSNSHGTTDPNQAFFVFLVFENGYYSTLTMHYPSVGNDPACQWMP